MSTVCNYEVGCFVIDQIRDVLVHHLGGYESRSRWAGVSKQAWHCQRFTIKLPQQIVGVMLLVERLLKRRGGMVAANGQARLRLRLYGDLGLPVGYMQWVNEKRFIDAVRVEPDQLANWMAYADWLVENGYMLRGFVMASWLSQKRVRRLTSLERRQINQGEKP